MKATEAEAYEAIKNQFYRDLEVVKELAKELGLPASIGFGAPEILRPNHW